MDRELIDTLAIIIGYATIGAYVAHFIWWVFSRR